VGTFAVEAVRDASKCKLPAPEITPANGNYTQRVNVTISHERADQGAKLFFSLDGRDPFLAGKRYRGSLTLTSEYNFLRVVAVLGAERSVVVERRFRVCHYAVPDEVVSGSIKVRTFPEVEHHVITAFSQAVEVPRETVTLKVTMEPNSTNGKCWMRIPITDPTPAHRLKIDRAFTIVKGDAKKRAYLDKFAKDIKKATGAFPENLSVTAGSIIVDFTLAREPAAEMLRQLADPTSFLLTKAKLKGSFSDAEYRHAESLGDRVSDPQLHSTLHKALGVKASVDEVIGTGHNDEGVIAICCPESQVKKLKKPFTMHVSKACQDLGAVVDTVLVGPEELSVDFSIEVVNDERLGAGDLVRRVNGDRFRKDMERELSTKGLLDTDVAMKTRATSREVSELEFLLQWDFPEKPKNDFSRLPDYLDGICLIFSEDDLVEVVDFRSASGESNVRRSPASQSSRQSAFRTRGVNRAVQHSGDVMSETGGQHRISLDLAALPPDVTDLYFVLAGYDCKDISLFPNPAVEIIDACSRQNMMKYSIASAGSTEAVIMCSLTRAESRKWIVRGLGIPTEGNVNNYDPIQAVVAKLQVGYGHWERRSELVLLRVLHKLDRLLQSSSSDFGCFMGRVLALPVPIFQLVVTFM